MVTRKLGLLTLILTLIGTFSAPRFLYAQAEAEIPQPVPPLEKTSDDIVNFLLIGSDTSNPQNSGRTDVLLIVSVNRTHGAVAMLSLPRDLYVYIPDWQMQRINTAYGHGEMVYGEGGGAQLLKDTILYNLGVQIDFYARVDFNGFKQVIDSAGGIDISVDCAIQDWRLREPDLDVTVEENWEMFTLPIGVHFMDGDLALWYVRSRRTSSDFDRGRRQQDMIRALWRRISNLGLLDQLPDIWQQVTEIVETDMALADAVGLIPAAINFDANRLSSYTFKAEVHVRQDFSPEGSSILVPVPEKIREVLRDMQRPLTQSQAVTSRPTVQIINGSGYGDLAQVAADRLAWEGYAPVIAQGSAVSQRQYTMIYDYTGRTKGSSLSRLQSVLRVSDEGVRREPDPNREYDYAVILGSSYYACTHNVLPPKDLEADTAEAG